MAKAPRLPGGKDKEPGGRASLGRVPGGRGKEAHGKEGLGKIPGGKKRRLSHAID